MNQMTQMFGQMMMWPMTMFADMVSRSMQGMQSMGMQSTSCLPCTTGTLATATERSTDWSAEKKEDWGCRDRCQEDWSCRDRCDDEWIDCRGSQGSCGSGEGCGCGCGCNRCRSGNCCRSGCHGGSDKVWLVEYSIVNVGRGGDYNVPCRQRLIRDCMSCEEFKNWVIADYVREHPNVNGKNLRVYVKVLDSWCKEEWDYEERQIEVLEEIRNAIRREN